MTYQLTQPIPYWRVTVDGVSGKILSCDECSGSEAQEAKHVYYVQATDAQKAILQAYKIYLATQRGAKRVRRALYKSQGRCVDCGEEPAESNGEKLTHCRRCLDSQKAAKDRRSAKRSGKPVADLPSKAVAFAQTRERRESQSGLELLREVQRAWCHCHTDSEFTGWLTGKIREFERKAAA